MGMLLTLGELFVVWTFKHCRTLGTPDLWSMKKMTETPLHIQTCLRPHPCLESTASDAQLKEHQEAITPNSLLLRGS